MATENIKAILEANAVYASRIPDRGRNFPAPPSRKLLILTCMDTRIDPVDAFGLRLGSTHVVRNAGAMARDALGSIITSQQELGTDEVILIKHTMCGVVPEGEVDQATLNDVRMLQNNPQVRGKISGWVYDVKTGRIREARGPT